MAYRDNPQTGEKPAPANLKRMNQKKIYDYIYETKLSSRQAIAHALDLSLPTVNQSLTAFTKMGLIEKRGEYQSTGGRKAQMICCNERARIAVGVEILKESVQIAAIDLYGTILKEASFDIPFYNEETYYQKLGDRINRFIEGLHCRAEQNLGVCIAIQGLVSADNETITFSEILGCTGAKRSTYQKYIHSPCFLIHDTEASAMAEIWHNRDLQNAVYLSLNRNFGGTLIIDGHVYQGKELGSGIIEHMCLYPDGPACYCGKQGCIECYCSADSLKNAARMDLPLFFERVHLGDLKCNKIWKNYLKHLALAVDNIRMILDMDFIIGGYLMQFMNEDDVDLLTKYVQEQCAFRSPNFRFRIGKYDGKSAMVGAAITLVDQFLNTIN